MIRSGQAKPDTAFKSSATCDNNGLTTSDLSIGAPERPLTRVQSLIVDHIYFRSAGQVPPIPVPITPFFCFVQRRADGGRLR